MKSIGSTLIINDGEPVSSLEALRLLVKSIFRKDDLDPDAEAMVQTLFGHKELLQSSDSVAAGLRNILFETLKQPGGDTPAIKELLHRVIQHELDTHSNRHVYVQQDKLNPNAVWWPNPTREGETRSIYTELPFARFNKIVNRSTPIGSAGSCFAMEIADRLQTNGFNYVITEDNLNPRKGVHNSCANWGVIFNVPAFRQLVEKAFGHRTLPKVLWSMEKDGGVVYRDPFREEVEFSSVEEYESGYERHIEAAREALTKVKVFVITLGLNEVWYLKSDGSVFSRNPWRFSPSLVERKVLTVEENVAELQKMLELWRSYNPDLKLIVSVSPVPLLATFQGHDMHVATATCQGKATLRLAAEQFVRQNEGVYYFPSFEKVMYCTEKPFEKDQRHVTRETVAGVMETFDTIFVDANVENDRVEIPQLQDEAVVLPGDKSFNLLIQIGTMADTERAERAVHAYLRAFQANDDAQLVIWTPQPEAVDLQEMTGWLQGLIRESGSTQENCSEILLLDNIPMEHRDALLPSIQAIVKTGNPGEEDTLRQAESMQIRIIEPDSRAYSLAKSNWKELLSSIAVAEELKNQAGDEGALRLLNTYETGCLEFYRTGTTPHESYLAMRQLYCASNGVFNDNLKKAYAKVYPAANLPLKLEQGILAGEDPVAIRQAMDRDGYYVFNRQLDEATCDRLMAYARTTPCHPRYAGGIAEESVLYESENPIAVRYDFDEQLMLENQDIQRLVMDESLLDLAEAYMGCEPAIDLVAMWWSTALQVDSGATSRAAQLFHFDMDRANLFKFFIYLNDVTLENGPHCFIRGSHLRKPEEILRDGRIPDEEVGQYYPGTDMVQLTGKKGTIIAADTRGYHKGMPLKQGERLIFQLQFGSSLFGAPYKPIRVSDAFIPGFRDAMKTRKHLFQKFHS